MDVLRIVFMGTPAFAVPSFEALLSLEPIDGVPVQVVGVFTQPDRPAGRGNRLVAPPVKDAALAAGIPVEQPERLRRPEAFAALAALAPDLIVVAAYGQILAQKVLDLPRFGCLNVHASLLPRHRGAAPIQAAILAGDAETGVCIMRMDAGLDTGPVLRCVSEQILPGDTAASLSSRLAVAGASLLAHTVPDWAAGRLAPQPQDAALATMSRPLRKEDGAIDWTRPAVAIERQIRAMTPWPGGFTSSGGALLKILAARAYAQVASSLAPGTVTTVHGVPYVATGEGLLELLVVQPAGKRPMASVDWLRGAQSIDGSCLGAVQPAD